MNEIKFFLDNKVKEFQNIKFLETDPIQVPHQFTNKQDIEIASFLTASIAWGNRKSIINNAFQMINYLDNSPFDFVMNYTDSDLINLNKFVHRTFQGIDFQYFIKSLNNIYTNYGSLENVFKVDVNETTVYGSLKGFREIFFSLPHPKRTQKHVSHVIKNSACKRLNMMLRWLVRESKYGVDFQLWRSIKPSQLSIPLDVHSGNVARKLGLLKRKQNDWKAVIELDNVLRTFDPSDPVKYDFALFGLGVFEKF